MEKVTPIPPKGSVKNDPVKIEARHIAQVQVVIFLGGAHDLTESIRQVAVNCECLRVTTKRYKELGE